MTITVVKAFALAFGVKSRLAASNSLRKRSNCLYRIVLSWRKGLRLWKLSMPNPPKGGFAGEADSSLDTLVSLAGVVDMLLPAVALVLVLGVPLALVLGAPLVLVLEVPLDWPLELSERVCFEEDEGQ